MKAKHQPSGLTPEPVSRMLRLHEESEDLKTEDADMKNTEAAEELLAELQSLKVQTAYLLAQHANGLERKRARR